MSDTGTPRELYDLCREMGFDDAQARKMVIMALLESSAPYG